MAQKCNKNVVEKKVSHLFLNIDQASGLISTTTRMLDREAQDEHVLEILVGDHGQPPLNSTTRVIGMY